MLRTKSENKKDYLTRMEAEIKHYKHIFKHSLFQEVPPVWNEVERKFSNKIRRATGVAGLPEYIARHTIGRKKIKILSLGSGACGVELDMVAPLLKKQKTELELVSMDINGEVLAQAQLEAQKRNINFRGVKQDINNLTLLPQSYDVIMVFAALHHFENVNRVAKQINLALKPKGIFVTVDIPSRNGYKLWDEAKALIDLIWKVLPTKYKWDHTVSKVPIYMPQFPDVDYSIGSFEATNSEAILPSLRKHLNEIVFVPAHGITRRFFDTKFGPNYNMKKTFDKSLFELITDVDDMLVNAGVLKPETFFGCYTKKL